MTRRRQTPSQTIGPFFHDGLAREGENVLAGEGAEGTRIRIEGTVLDADRNPIEDALIEIWQANGRGRYRHPSDARDLPLDNGFTGFGRTPTDPATGEYWFETVKPGPVPDAEGEMQAPHISVIISARGMLKHSFTRMYFADDAATAGDPILATVPEHRRATLLAMAREGGPVPTYRFDIRFGGGDETVFFDV